jgi:hypothetical protein
MKTSFATLTLATSMLFGAAMVSNAEAWTRSSASTGPKGGTYSSSGAGSCSGGRCASSQAVTGRRGNTVTRNGSTSCGGGSCTGTATYTGPAGNTATRTRSFSR